MTIITVSADEVRAAVPMPDAIRAVRDAFVGFARGDFEMPTRPVMRGGEFLVMPISHVPSATAAIKSLSLNFGGRKPAILGTVVWSDLDRVEQLVADAGAITALRTGAASGVATDLLARVGATRLTVIGAGTQAPDQIRAVCAVRAIESIVIVDKTLSRAESVAHAVRAEFPDTLVTAATHIPTAVADADIICCVTTSTQPLFALDDLRPDVHVNAIGAFRPSMRELPDELLADVAAVYIDELEATLSESGEVIHAIANGAIDADVLVELGTVLAEDGFVRAEGRTVFKSVGIAAQDWAIARVLSEVYLPAAVSEGVTR